MKHIEKLSYKYINTYGRFSQHRKSEEPIINKINEIIDILEKEGFCKIKDKNFSQLLEIVKLREENNRLNNIITELEKWLKDKEDLTCGCGITVDYLYAYENCLDKLKELKENNNV